MHRQRKETLKTHESTVIRIWNSLAIYIRPPQLDDRFRSCGAYAFEVAEVGVVGGEDVGEGVEVLFGDLAGFVFYGDAMLVTVEFSK